MASREIAEGIEVWAQSHGVARVADLVGALEAWKA
jgi:hypothetical protein